VLLKFRSEISCIYMDSNFEFMYFLRVYLQIYLQCNTDHNNFCIKSKRYHTFSIVRYTDLLSFSFKNSESHTNGTACFGTKRIIALKTLWNLYNIKCTNVKFTLSFERKYCLLQIVCTAPFAAGTKEN
jgi:hypothetical protein